jgi:hypothetical protein
MTPREFQLAEAVRQACLAAATDAAEEAGVRGLCAEGRLELAIDAIRCLSLETLHLPDGRLQHRATERRVDQS